MLRIMQIAVAVMGLTIAGAAWTQAPAGAPSGSTGLCKDGSYTSAATKRGACRGHKGVQTWYAATSGASGASAATGESATSTTHAKASEPAAAAPEAAAAPSSEAAAPGGGAGQVWVNKRSKVYHCPGDRYYGKTKSGAYMSEADAKTQGYRPDHGKACR